MESYVEHVNLTVSNTDSSLKFIQTAVPDFLIRKRWKADGYEWTHIGTDMTYIALMESLSKPDDEKLNHRHDTERLGYNHVCIVVSSVDDVRDRLLEQGYTRGFNNGNTIVTSVRKSIYFNDPDDNEFEFMEYLTDEKEKRNSYEI